MPKLDYNSHPHHDVNARESQQLAICIKPKRETDEGTKSEKTERQANASLGETVTGITFREDETVKITRYHVLKGVFEELGDMPMKS